MLWERFTWHISIGGLSFKKLQQFNIAILGKLGWNLIRRPDSLAARVLQTRYSPSSTMLDAQLGSNPSYV